ncbi:MAG: ArgE/DapE family deacylase [Armatimonadetes bacterium]|nr:ArgE/DapE family deacylase [Armatimonadota bacterium]
MIQIDADRTVALLARLVSINSVNPDLVPGAPGEGEIAAFLADYCRAVGLEVRLQEAAPGRPNVIARLPGIDPRGGRSLILNGHVDTVSTERMTIPPLEPRIDGGRMYGRGAYDMKGGVAAMVAAVEAIRRVGLRLKGDVLLAMVADEEYASLGTEAVVREYRADAAIVTEPTGLDLCLAHKGFAWLRVETRGRAAHGSLFDEGVDAIVHMGRVLRGLEQIETEELPRRRHPLLVRPSLHAATVRGGLGLSTYPDRCTLEVERRMLPAETPGGVEAEARGLLARLAAEDPRFSATVEVFFSRPGYEIAPDAPIVRAAEGAARKVLGRTPRPTGVHAWLDSAILGTAGIPTAIFGPGGEGAHAAVEYVLVDEVIACAGVLAETIADFCGAL